MMVDMEIKDVFCYDYFDKVDDQYFDVVIYVMYGDLNDVYLFYYLMKYFDYLQVSYQ